MRERKRREGEKETRLCVVSGRSGEEGD